MTTTLSIVLKGPSKLSNLAFPGHTLLVLRPFIFYNAAKIAQVGAEIPICNPNLALSSSVNLDCLCRLRAAKTLIRWAQ
jgi:hypothetical protein